MLSAKNPTHPIAFDIKSLILLVVSIFRDRKNVVFFVFAALRFFHEITTQCILFPFIVTVSQFIDI